MKIENTSDALQGAIKFVIAGEAGNGKTTLARTIQDSLNERVLVISAEAGLLSLSGAGVDYIELQRRHDGEKWVDVPKDGRIGRLIEIFRHVSKPEVMAKYQWLFIDSLTEINQNMLEMLEANEEFQGPKNTIKKYGELSTRMRALCKTFRDLPHYNVVFSALVKEETDADNVKHMKVDMVGKFADQLPALFDEILYLGVMPDVGADGRNVRQILTQKTNKILFPKDRSGTLDRVEPADLGLIARKIRTGKRSTGPVALIADISAQASEAAAQAKAGS